MSVEVTQTQRASNQNPLILSPKRKSVIIATTLSSAAPHVNAFTVSSIINNITSLISNGVAFNYSFNITYTIDVGREVLVDSIYKMVDYVFFLDSDIILPNPNTIVTLINSGYPIVCIPYFEKTLMGPDLRVNGGKRMDVETIRQLFSQEPIYTDVDACGLGATLISTDVFKAIDRPWFKSDNLGLSEDLYFFDKVRAAGFKPVAYINKVMPAYHHMVKDVVLTPDGRLALIGEARGFNQSGQQVTINGGV